MPKQQKLAGRVAFVTGASSGIGYAVAQSLLQEGAKVALSARRADRLQELARAFPDEQTIVVPADLRREEDILTAFKAVREAWGGVDILVNSGGLGRKAPLTSGATDAWQEMLEVNVLGLCV